MFTPALSLNLFPNCIMGFIKVRWPEFWSLGKQPSISHLLPALSFKMENDILCQLQILPSCLCWPSSCDRDKVWRCSLFIQIHYTILVPYIWSEPHLMTFTVTLVCVCTDSLTFLKTHLLCLYTVTVTFFSTYQDSWFASVHREKKLQYEFSLPTKNFLSLYTVVSSCLMSTVPQPT